MCDAAGERRLSTVDPRVDLSREPRVQRAALRDRDRPLTATASAAGRRTAANHRPGKRNCTIVK